MNKARKQRVKEKKLARQHFYMVMRRIQRLEHLKNTMMRKSPGSFTASFYFSPEELGIEPSATLEQVEKLGPKRALERLDRKDFFRHISVRVKGEATAEHLAKVREEVRLDTIKKLQTNTAQIDLSKVSILEEPNEANETGNS